MNVFLEKRKLQLNEYVLIGIIFCLNLLIRFTFIFYGYISHDEGIAFYNAKLAYTGLVPFIHYNGWNSLVSDYIFGLPRIFAAPTIFSQRIYALLISAAVFWLVIWITRFFQSRTTTIFAAVFLTIGAMPYTYFSNIPYSVQLMTFFIVLSLFFLTRIFSRSTNFLFEYLTLSSLLAATLIRSQIMPLIFLFFLFFLFKKNFLRSYFIKMSLFLVITTICFYGPFFIFSIEHTLYAIFWPFFANKLLVYVHDVPKLSLTQLTLFMTSLFQDYGILFTLITVGSLTLAQWKKIYKSPKIQFIGLSILIVAEFFLVAIIHTPMDATYLYPAVPLIAIVSAYFLDLLCKSIPRSHRAFFILTLLILLIGQAIVFPHYKIIKTSLKTKDQTPHTILAQISNYIKSHTGSNDEVIAFYLPAIAESSLHVPLYLNEGPGSLSIANETIANKFHLTTLPTFRTYIASQKAQLLILPSTAIHFLGVNDVERTQTWNEIQKYYILDKEFSEFAQVDGSKASLLIFRLPPKAD